MDKYMTSIIGYIRGASFFLWMFISTSYIITSSEFIEKLSLDIASIGFYLLIGLVFFKSLFFILKCKNIYINKYLRFVSVNQREIGILTFYLVITHILVQFVNFVETFKFKSVAYGSGSIAALILLFMIATSFKFTQKKVNNWKKMHSIIWTAVALIFGHIYIVTGELIIYIAHILAGFIFIFVECFTYKKRGIIHLKLYSVGVLVSILTLYVVSIIQS